MIQNPKKEIKSSNQNLTQPLNQEKRERNNQLKQLITQNQKLIDENQNNLQAWVQLAKLYDKKRDYKKSIDCYQKLIELRPKNINFQLGLASVLKKQGQLDKAIQVYENAWQLSPEKTLKYIELYIESLILQSKYSQAISLYEEVKDQKKDFSPSFYTNLAEAFFKQEKWEQAITYYQTALAEKSVFKPEVYLQLRESFIQQGQTEAANIVYQKQLENHYLINQTYKIIYCPIAKNACTYFKYIMLINSEYGAKYEALNLRMDAVHGYTKQNQTIASTNLNLKDLIPDSKYFKFTVLRNPLKRIVSGYVGKFGKQKHVKTLPDYVKKVIQEVYKSLDLEADYEKSITFNQFVHYLANTKDYDLNSHWRSQVSFMGKDLLKFDYIGQFEKLNLTIEYLQNQLGLTIKEGEEAPNVTVYGNYSSEEKFHNYYPGELRNLAGFPKAENFYTPELEELIRIRYSEDIKLYESQFNEILTNLN